MKGRNEGIDILRCVSMFMVLCMHILGQGGVMVRYANQVSTYSMAWLIETLAFCAVNVYGMISGYVGVRAKWRVSRIAELWLGVLFYTLGITGICAILHPEWITREVLLQSFLPVSWRTYWYFSSFAALFFLEPFLNKMICAAGDKRRQLMWTLFIVFSVMTTVPKVFQVDALRLSGGYSLLWLLVLYLLGGCLREEEEERGRKSRIFYLTLYLVLALFSWAVKVLIDGATMARLGKLGYGTVLVTYTAPTMVLCAGCLLYGFTQLSLRTKAGKLLCRYLSGVSFFVYIIHLHPLVWDHLLKNAFRAWGHLAPMQMTWRVLVTALGLYLVLSALDGIRYSLFRLLKVRERSEALITRFGRAIRKEY